MPNRRKSKRISKEKSLSKGKNRVKVISKSKVNRDDPLWVSLNKDYKRDKLRRIAKKWQIPLSDADGTKNKADLSDDIYLKMKKGVKVDKSPDIDRVVVENFPNEAIVLITDETLSGEVLDVQTQFPKPLKRVKIEESEGRGYQIEGTTLENEKIVLRANIAPSEEKGLKHLFKDQKQYVVFKKGETWNKKPIHKPAPHFETIKENYVNRKFTNPLNKRGKEEKRKYNYYIKHGLIPIYKGRSGSLVDPKHFDSLIKVEWTAESVEKMLGVLDKKEMKNKSLFRSTVGNKTQTKISKDGKFLGIFYSNTTGKADDPNFNSTPTMFKAKKIRADSDGIGQMQAWIINTYAHNNPNLKNIVNASGKIGIVDYDIAMKGLAGSIIDSKAYYRNNIVKQSIKDAFGDSALAYLPKGSSKAIDLPISDQQVRAAGLIVQDEMDIEVQSPDFIATFPFKVQSFDEGKPELVFKFKYKPKVEPLDSDTLLLIATQQLKMESTTIQNLLEALYQQRWISYPRSNIAKAEAEPIQIRNPKTGLVIKNGKQAQKLLNDKQVGFQGSLHEKQLLDIIVKSQIATDEKKPFIQTGSWYLVSGNLRRKSKRDNHVLLVGNPDKYTADQIDINVGERGILEEDLVADLIEENVGTPSTRTAMLEQLKSAGILSRRGNRLVVDRRGYYLAALDNYYNDNQIERAYYLKNRIVGSNDLKIVSGVVDAFDWLTVDDKADIRKYLVSEVGRMVEAESDLSYLDREGSL